MSALGLSHAISAGVLDPNHKLLFMGCCDVEYDGQAVVSVSTLSDWACIPENMVWECLVELEELGFLVAESEGGGREFNVTIHALRLPEKVVETRKPVPVKIRAAVYERDGMNCRYCGSDTTDCATLDHILPQSRGGLHTMENLTVCCSWCNSSKRDKTEQEFMDYLAATGGPK